MNDELNLEKQLEVLRQQHRALDNRLGKLAIDAYVDQLQLARLKREKLALRDKITAIEDELYPDIIA